MYFGSVRLAIAIGVAIPAFAAIAASAQDAAAGKLGEGAEPVQGVTRAVEETERSKIDSDFCYQIQSYEEAALCVQSRAAIAAEVAAEAARRGIFIGTVSSFLSLAGLVLVVLALREARNANKISSEIGQSQLRAYLSVDLTKFSLGEKGFPKLAVKTRNLGQTPASNLTLKIRVKYIGGGEEVMTTAAFQRPDIGSGEIDVFDRELPWLSFEEGKFGANRERLERVFFYIGAFGNDIFLKDICTIRTFFWKDSDSGEIFRRSGLSDDLASKARFDEIGLSGPYAGNITLEFMVPAKPK